MPEVNANNRWVRIQRQTKNGFVEFEFFVSDKELYVELILPATAFREFCSINRVRFLDPGAEPGTADTAECPLRRIK
jgi:phenol hydroxylase P0 protein